MKNIIMLLSMICAGGCSSGPKADPFSSSSDEIVKVVAIALVKADQKDANQASFGGWFIETSLAHWAYMRNAFVNSNPPVKFVNECIKYPDKIVNKYSKRAGILISINEPSFIDNTHAEVVARYYQGPFSFASFIYNLSKVDGKWVIQNSRVTAAS